MEAQFLCSKYDFIDNLFTTEKRMNKLFVKGSRTLGHVERKASFGALTSLSIYQASIVYKKNLHILFSGYKK